MQNIISETERVKIEGELKKKPKAISEHNPKEHPFKMEIQIGDIRIIAPPRAWADSIQMKTSPGGITEISISTKDQPKLAIIKR